MNNAEPMLRTDKVYKTYPNGNVRALGGVSVHIRRGEYVCIMGPSGSGKSTLLNVLGGLDRPDEGQVFFGDKPLCQHGCLDRFRAQKLGFVFQSFLLLPTLSALENVQIPMFEGTLSAKNRAAKAHELLQEVGLEGRAHHAPNQLSVGERQRVAIARALANDPPLILADEPTGNLDSRSAAEILNLFDGLRRQRNLTFVVVTHCRNLARRADRSICLRDGELVDCSELGLEK